MKKTITLFTLLAIAVCSKATVHEVAIQNFVFSPATLTIVEGDTVIWTNLDSAPHTATSTSVPSGATTFNSGNLIQNASFSFVFRSSGDYAYRCNVHTHMTASITVTAPLGIVKEQRTDFSIYPNPVTDFVTIEGEKSTLRYEILNVAGLVVSSGSGNKIDFRSFERGTYLVRILNGDKPKAFQLIKE